MNTLFIFPIFVICFSRVVPLNIQKFPDDFLFGTATASYQVEGGWNASGKGENIWDRLTHDHPDWIADRSNGDVACDSYDKYNVDIKLLKELGVNYYRFSLSWARILPSGFANKVNKDGVQYYNNLINGLISNNITPMVTLYHWDLPQPLNEIGGWPNELLAKLFEDYARVVFASFGDRVKMWITFNEPAEVCQGGYGDGSLAPAYASDGIGDYLCGRTLLLAHAKAYRLYDKEFRKLQKGKVGITISALWIEPKTYRTGDIEAAERAMQMDVGWWAHPIYSKEGDYPEIMKQRINDNSRRENFPRSRLPPFTAEEVKFIRGTHDFFGLNHYTTRLGAEPNLEDNDVSLNKDPSYYNDIGVSIYSDPSWPTGSAAWLKVVPWGFRKLLAWVSKTYGHPDIYVTENGYADKGEINDDQRVNYIKLYMSALLEAIHLDGCNVKGYTVWSLLDNFEWRDGYTVRFGLHKVDFKDPNRMRTPKASAMYYKNVIKTRMVNASISY